MSIVQRIIDRCPRFYRSWDESSVISLLIKSLSGELDNAEDGITSLMRAHWVDTAEQIDLDRLGVIVGIKRGADEDEDFKSHLKKAVDEYKGGGTISAILNEFQDKIKQDEISIIENPPADSSAEFTVIANDTWALGSNSVEDEPASLSLTVEGEGEVKNPRITNLTTEQSIMFEGKLKTGEQLVIEEGKALIDEKDVTEKVKPLELPLLPRKGSKWKYSEALLEGLGVFDKGRFDENTFAVGVPTVKIRYTWTRRQPATFQINVKSEALVNSNLTEYYIAEKANCLKAAGVNVIVMVTERVSNDKI